MAFVDKTMNGHVFREEVPKPPSLALAALEGGRAFSELASLPFLRPLLESARSGDGHPVLFLPGLGAGDRSTAPLRSYLARRNYLVRGWGLGPNHGPGTVGPKMHLLEKRLNDLHGAAGRAVSVVGWSIGGIYARELARRVPKVVRQVITLGSPIHGDPRGTNLGRFLGKQGDEILNSEEIKDYFRRHLVPPPGVPCTSIYSKTDGIVSWRISKEMPNANTDNIEVVSSHFGLGVHPAVWYAIADRLSQSEDDWKPFKRHTWRRVIYPSAGH